MKIKQFILYSVVYVLLIGIVAFMHNSQSYSLALFNTTLTLPIAVWFILPVVLFALITVLHMGYYGIGIYFSKRSLRKDMKIYDDVAKDTLLGFETNKEFKSDLFKHSSEITKFLSPWQEFEYDPKLENDELKEVVKIVKTIKNGGITELRKYRVPVDSKIYIQNELNKLLQTDNYYVEILKDRRNIQNELLKQRAYAMLLQKGSFLDIKKYELPSKKEEILVLVDRFVKDKEFQMPRDDLYTLILKAEFTASEYIAIAKKLINYIDPDNLIAMFERLKSQKEEAREAYMYLLYEYGMIDKLRENLSFQDEKFEKFEILTYLRDNGKNIPASYFY